MVAPERGPLKDEVEVDEFELGGVETGKIGYRRRDSSRALVAIAVEVRGQGSGRLRLQVILRRLGSSRSDAFIKRAVAPGAVIHTDGWRGYDHVAALGYVHERRSQRAMPGVQLLPRAHRAVSNLKAWVHGTH